MKSWKNLKKTFRIFPCSEKQSWPYRIQQRCVLYFNNRKNISFIYQASTFVNIGNWAKQWRPRPTFPIFTENLVNWEEKEIWTTKKVIHNKNLEKVYQYRKKLQFSQIWVDFSCKSIHRMSRWAARGKITKIHIEGQMKRTIRLLGKIPYQNNNPIRLCNEIRRLSGMKTKNNFEMSQTRKLIWSTVYSVFFLFRYWGFTLGKLLRWKFNELLLLLASPKLLLLRKWNPLLQLSNPRASTLFLTQCQSQAEKLASHSR